MAELKVKDKKRKGPQLEEDDDEKDDEAIECQENEDQLSLSEGPHHHLSSEDEDNLTKNLRTTRNSNKPNSDPRPQRTVKQKKSKNSPRNSSTPSTSSEMSETVTPSTSESSDVSSGAVRGSRKPKEK